MTTLKQIELQCPVCDRSFRSQAVISTNSFGGRRTDFHERAAGTQPLPYQIHACNRCGYAGKEYLFQGFEIKELSDHVKDRVWNEITPKFSGEISGSEKYEASATISEWEDEARESADLWLRAAWCAVDEGDAEAERYYRLKAVKKFIEAFESFDGISAREQPIICYLIGELWRRIGFGIRAKVWFASVRDLVGNDELEELQWVIDQAEQQREDPKEWFGR